MSKSWVASGAELAPYIDRIWEWENETDLPVLLPGTGSDAIFNLGDPILLESGPNGGSDTDDANGTGLSTLPDSFVMSMRDSHFKLMPTGRVSFIGIRFKSGKLKAFCGEPMRALSDRFAACEDLWGERAAELRERMGNAATLRERAAFASEFFGGELGRKSERDGRKAKSPAWLDWSIHELYYRFAETTVEEVAERTGVSRRQLERQFVDAIGIGPKSFQKNARFQSVLKELLISRSAAYLDAALKAGYCDQSHFIHDFTRRTGETPTRFLSERNFMSHFYNPKIAR